MKKNTQNQIVAFQNILNTIQMLNTLNIKNYSILLVLFTSLAFGQSNNCKANLEVENNGNIRYTPLEGTYYAIIISNTGTTTDTYSLSINNINSSCENTDGSSTASNVSINTSFIDTQKNAINSIEVNANESKKFYVHVTVPTGTGVKKWNCSQVIAKSTNCSIYQVSTILHSYIIDTSVDN